MQLPCKVAVSLVSRITININFAFSVCRSEVETSVTDAEPPSLFNLPKHNHVCLQIRSVLL